MLTEDEVKKIKQRLAYQDFITRHQLVKYLNDTIRTLEEMFAQRKEIELNLYKGKELLEKVKGYFDA